MDRVAFLACGWALASRESHGTSIALDTDAGVILVDAGGGPAKELARSFGLERLTDVYLTHEHPDHTWGLPGLLHCLRFAGARGPLRLHAPAPARARVQGALEALGVTTPFELQWTDLAVANGHDDRARWTPADHTVPTLAYRFGDVVVCGDTRPAEHIAALADGASLLLHEASHSDEQRTHGAGHSTPADAGRIARQAKVGTLALIHIHPSLPRAEAANLADFHPLLTPVDGHVAVRTDRAWTLES